MQRADVAGSLAFALTSRSMPSSREIIRKLEDDGWTLDRQRGPHCQFVHRDRPGIVTVPHPVKDLTLGTLRSIYRQAGWRWPP
jgi:predicted RNA binding protein YcfA (HicA-like mRNA interferase family)